MSTVYDYIQTRLNWSTDTRSQHLVLTKIREIIVSNANRRLYRHESGMGTVIRYNDGETKRVLVLDAAYRSTSKQLRSTTEKVLSLNEYNSNNQYGNGYIITPQQTNVYKLPMIGENELNKIQEYWKT